MVFKHFDLGNMLHYGEFYELPIITQVKIPHYPILVNQGLLGAYSVPGIWEIIFLICTALFPTLMELISQTGLSQNCTIFITHGVKKANLSHPGYTICKQLELLKQYDNTLD